MLKKADAAGFKATWLGSGVHSVVKAKHESSRTDDPTSEWILGRIIVVGPHESSRCQHSESVSPALLTLTLGRETEPSGRSSPGKLSPLQARWAPGGRKKRAHEARWIEIDARPVAHRDGPCARCPTGRQEPLSIIS
jgi:hypothetical protein